MIGHHGSKKQEVPQDDIKRFADEVVKGFNPERVLLLGSHASENASGKSHE
jgi:hypothetical protein